MTRLVIRGGSVFDGTSAPISQADVVVADGHIVEVGQGLDGDVAFDATGCTVLPGLFDCHVHVMMTNVDWMQALLSPFSYAYYEAAHNLRSTLATGITSIRDAAGADLGVKRAVETGLIKGPRMQISISALSQTGGHGDATMPSGHFIGGLGIPGVPPGVVDGPDEMRRRVRELVRAGADVIKVCTTGGVLSPADNPQHSHFRLGELEVLVEEATAAGLFVMSHAQGSEGIKNAVRAGIRSIEHGIYLDDEAIAMMLERGTWLVPTLVAPQGVIDAAAGGASISDASLAKAREVVEIHRESFRKAVAAGVKVAMGTDSAITPHGENLRELSLMHAGGMDPQDVLIATTRSAAELLGVDNRLGSLAPGKVADVTVIEGDGLDFTNLRERVRAVFLDGQQVIDGREAGRTAGAPSD